MGPFRESHDCADVSVFSVVSEETNAFDEPRWPALFRGHPNPPFPGPPCQKLRHGRALVKPRIRVYPGVEALRTTITRIRAFLQHDRPTDDEDHVMNPEIFEKAYQGQ